MLIFFIKKQGDVFYMTKHPIQQLEKDEEGKLRFKQNSIVRFLKDTSKYNLNELALMPFDREDWEQFAQLIGYSLDGFGELSYVSQETHKKLMNNI
jgi:hypothetical protein